MQSARYLTDLTLEAAQALAREEGFKPFHGKMLYRWIFRQAASDWDAMSDLPKPFRDRLSALYLPRRLARLREEASRDGTRKFLFGLPDGDAIETVLIPEPERLTICLSTQVGCAVRCAFCASGREGLLRNLVSGEIVEQVLAAAPGGEHRGLTNVVFMGMGEPLMNFEGLCGALLQLNEPEGIGLGARRITVSTVGIPQGIRKLAELGLQVNLAISIHAADEEKRRRLIPLAARYPLAEVLEAAEAYRRYTTRDVTYEVLLLKGVNDGREDADKLAALLRGRKGSVNLIPYNAVASSGFEGPAPRSVAAFRVRLEKSGLPVTVRKSKGADIRAACGQLRHSR